MKLVKPRAQRLVQLLSLILFTLLLVQASPPLSHWLPYDLYVRLDPVIVAATSISGRAIPHRLWLGFVLLFVPFVLGRAFCGWFCPMGIAIDVSDWLVKSFRRTKKKSNEKLPRWRWVKYAVLSFVIGSSLAGISLFFFVSPISLITRFAALVIYPVVVFCINIFSSIVRPIADLLGLYKLSYFQLRQPVFETNIFVFLMVGTIFSLGMLCPRFWCRYLCPSGAFIGIFSRRSLVRRRVNAEKCVDCGLCQKNCPNDAIGKDARGTRHEECLVCLKCSKICPENAISFGFSKSPNMFPSEVLHERRRVLLAGITGVVSAVLFTTNLDHLDSRTDIRPVQHNRLIRPPGSLPDPWFLQNCTRCGECVRVCPTNTLQPVWFMSGLEGLWSPRVFTAYAPCSQDCAACGQVCATGAIRPLDIEEKKFAKIGTARIYKARCLAWGQDRKCLVCDEVCPYNAVSFVKVPERNNRVPVVEDHKCIGCGFCESKCPVPGSRAIVVEVSGEVRLAEGSYREEAKRRRLSFIKKK